MARLPGLFQRGSVWWLRVMVPVDLRPAFGGRSKVVRSLNTPDRRQASRLALGRRAELLSGFERGHLNSVLDATECLPIPLALLPPSATPEEPEPTEVSRKIANNGRGLREVFDRWKTSKRRTGDTVKACARALEAFEAVVGRPALADIKRDDGVTFRAELPAQQTSSKTAHDRLTWVKSLLRFAYRDLEWLDRQPWEGLDLPHRTEAPRRP